MTKKEKAGRRRLIWSGVAIAVASFIAGTQIDRIMAVVAPAFSHQSGTLDLASVQQTYQQLKQNYDGPLDEKALINGASRGLVAAAGDQHTVYMDAKEAAEFTKLLNGSIGGGIGAEIGTRDGHAVIIRPLAQSPAEKAGIQAGDVIAKVNDESTAGWTVDQVVAKIRGEAGTTVKLQLLRGGEEKLISVTRQEITAPAVESRIEGTTGILTVRRFADDTAAAARRAAEGFQSAGVTKVILDLRGNPGGTVASAQALAGLWLKQQTIMTERRGTQVTQTVQSVGKPLFEHTKTVVLINNGSASASEIIAGALKEHGKATLVGEKSYGKGSVQVVIGLAGGAQLKVTEARWYTPKGKNIDKSGIQPDETVTLTAEDTNAGRDTQLEKAKSL